MTVRLLKISLGVDLGFNALRAVQQRNALAEQGAADLAVRAVRESCRAVG
jgi:hypothetical protein